MPSFEETIEQLEDAGVAQATIDSLKEAHQAELDASSLRKKLGELEAWKREQGEPALQKLNEYQTEPVRAESLKKLGLDYDSQPPYAKDWLRANIPADKLSDAEFVASKIQEGGFQTVAPQPEPQPLPNAAGVVNQAVSGGQQGAPVDRAALFAGAKTPEEVAQLAAQFPPE